ncbi:hypothetical protein [Nocardia sp. NPDC059239]|uniref:hypothetical protein n=1 Tax=unclassified Nocardia TaxID=2637762 RepID=UPI0036888E85
MAIAEVDQALARLDADHGEIAANLAELEADPGVRFLDRVPLTGVTAIGHPLLKRLDGIEDRLNTERALAMSDPLSLAERRPAGGDPMALTRELETARDNALPLPPRLRATPFRPLRSRRRQQRDGRVSGAITEKTA